MRKNVKRFPLRSWRQLRVLRYDLVVKSRRFWRYLFLLGGIALVYLTHDDGWLILSVIGVAILIAEEIYPF
jgi:hypothetical protein